MNKTNRLRSTLAASMAALMVGGLFSAPTTARADDPKDKPVAGKAKEKKPTIPIKIVAPIIVPDKDKDKKAK